MYKHRFTDYLLNLNFSELFGLLFLINFPQILSFVFNAPMQDDLDIKHTLAPILDSFLQTNWIFNGIQFNGSFIVFILLWCKFNDLLTKYSKENRVYKDIKPVIEEVVEYSESHKDNSFLFHKIHNQTLIENSKT